MCIVTGLEIIHLPVVRELFFIYFNAYSLNKEQLQLTCSSHSQTLTQLIELSTLNCVSSDSKECANCFYNEKLWKFISKTSNQTYMSRSFDFPWVPPVDS